MRNPLIAFALNFIFPGAGLWYLRKWSAGWLNLFAVLVVGGVFIFGFPEFYWAFRAPIVTGVAGACGATGFIMARRQNEVPGRVLAA